ncbi:MAG: hypothetical protein ACI4RT_00290 [Candidatus Spyradenecus sp.]
MKCKLLATLCVLSLMGWIHAQEAVSNPAVAAITVGETTTEYPTLDEALSAANEAGASQTVTVKLLQDVTRTTDVALGAAYPITLDLAGYTLDCGTAQFYTKSTGLVTLTGNGTVKNDNATTDASYAAIQVYTGSALKLNGVTVEGNYCAVRNNGTLTVEAATIKATKFGIGNFGNGAATIGTESGDNTKISITSGWPAITSAAATGTEGASVVVYGGSFTTSGTQWDEGPIYWAGHGSLTVYGGTFTNTGSNTGAAGLLQKNGTVAVYGGTFSAKDGIKLVAQSDSTELTTTLQGGTFTGTRSGLYIDASNATYMGQLTAYEVTVANGETATPTFKGGSERALYTKTNGLGSRTLMTMTGGLYNEDPSTYCAAGYMASETMVGGETLWAVQPAVAQIGETSYPSLEAAIAAAVAGDTVTLLQDVTQEDGFVLTKDLTLDLGGKTFTVETGASTSNRNIKVTGTANLTVKHGTMVAGGECTAVNHGTNGASAGTGCYGTLRFESTGKLVVTDVTLKNSRPWGMNLKLLSGTAELENVTILSTCGGGVEVAGNEDDHTQHATVTMRNCTIKQTYKHDHTSACVAVSYGGELTVESGSYTSDFVAVYVYSSGGIQTIQGGTFTGATYAIKADRAADASAAEVHVSGGTFVGPLAESGAKISLTGGLYNEDPTAYCAEGYCCATNKLKIEQTVFYALRKQSAVFEVCSAFSNGYQAAYENLTEALTAAQTFSTKLVNVVGAGTVSEDVVIPADTYLDIYASGASLTVPADKTLTVSANCKRLGVRTGTLAIEAGGKVLIAGGQYTGSSNAGLVAVWKSGASVSGEFSLPEGHILYCTENASMASYWSAPEADKVAEATLADGRVANLTASAMSYLPTGWTQLKLFQDVSCNTTISTANAVIDLNKKTWTGTSKTAGVFTIKATGVTVKNGTVAAGASQPYAINLQSGSLTLESNATITGGSSCALYCQGDTSLTTAGTITNTDAPAIAGNGTKSGTSITVTGGTITATNSTAIYHPQSGTLEIQKGTIKGYNGIQMCAGELKVTGGSTGKLTITITATGTDIATSKTGTDGPINDGAAISVVNRSYPGGTPTVSVTASSATITSDQAKAVYAYTWQDSASTKVCEPWSEAAQYIALSNGYYSEDVSGYCAEGYHAYYVATSATPKWRVLVTDTFEASVTHGDVVTQYATLSAANYASQAGDTLTLNRALENVGSLSVKVTKENLMWDLNGITLKSPLNVQANGFKIKNGTMAPRSTYNPPATLKTTTGTRVDVTLEDVKVYQNYTASSTISLGVPGTLTLSGNTQVQAGNGTGIDCSATGVGVTVASSASITGAVGVSIWGTKQSDGSYDAQGVKVQVDGTITATEIGVNLYGTIKATTGTVPEITVGPTAQVTSSGVGAYAAGYGKWTVADGAQISGALSGIEIRAGELTVDGGTIKSLADSYSIEPNGSGTTTVGAGIAVAQHGTKLPLKVTVSGGEISGYVALSEANPQGNEAEAIEKVSLDIQGGTFTAQSAAVVSADCTGFISGGNFSNAVPLAYCATGKVPKTLKAGDTGYTAAAPYTVVTPTSENFVAVKADGSATVYDSLTDVPNETKVYIAPSAETDAAVAAALNSARATTGPAEDPKDATAGTGLTVKEVAEVLGGAFTVSQVEDAEGQTTETKLVYHYNFGVAGLEVSAKDANGAQVLSVVAQLTEGELPANRTLTGRTLQVVVEKGDGTNATYSVANPVFDIHGKCAVPVPWEAMTHGTNAIRVKVVK